MFMMLLLGIKHMQTFDTATVNSTDYLNAFKNGDISLSQLAKLFNQNLESTISLLGDVNIPIADYTIKEELSTLNKLGL